MHKPYLEAIANLGFSLHSCSRWLNSALFTSCNPDAAGILESLNFVKEVSLVKRPVVKSSYHDKLDTRYEEASLFDYDNPVMMLNGRSLHNSGFDGSGVTIAVLDGGYFNADIISSLSNLRQTNRIKGTYDFVRKSENVFSYHNHGTAVLSVLAGDTPGFIRGSAPGASYWLFRTEDTSTEFPAEEDYWAAAAEFADSAGCDIISTSLGYSTFDDPGMDYKYTDMDGKTTFISRAAEIAASKGILVVASAGNERNKPWVRIVAPSDGKNVISAGAVDASNVISSFSSAGPSSDNRVKPDNVAQGVGVIVQVNEKSFSSASGTSFSCPVLSGMCACILQAVPDASPRDIINALHSCGDRAENPASLYGYGLPDVRAVVDTLQKRLVFYKDNEVTIAPNPFSDRTLIVFREDPLTLDIEVFSVTGTKIFSKSFRDYAGRAWSLDESIIRNQGIYLIRISTSKSISVHRIVKLPGR
ncbi:MAG: S8 family serine peptidase [Bacteroidales bacterium]|nr:S8 family serine peptidase [Bacteroidales bacterium]